jgi:hypothetical protein
MRNKKTIKFKIAFKKTMAVYMALTLFFEIAFPTASMALTGGPSQPEVESFEPVGTSEMVDPFSGDFSYNIPLLDVDGYPVNISYHSNVNNDQEASWVGLGWNINPGVISRGMRGIPDDFRGENITKEISVKDNKTYGLSLGVDFEFFGKDPALKGKKPQAGKGKGSLGYELSVRFNNYTGVGVDQTISGHLPIGVGGQSKLNVGLGLTSSSDNGLTIQPTVSFSTRLAGTDAKNTGLGLSIGTAFNSRGGLQRLTIGASIDRNRDAKKKKPFYTDAGHENFGGSSSFNFGMPTFTPQLTLPFQNHAISASFKIGGAALGGFINGKIGGYYASQKLIQKEISQPAYGYLNSDEGVKYDNAMMDINREKDGSFSPSTPALPVTNFTYDLLSVSGQGISGSYRPFRSDFGQVFEPNVSNPSLSGSIGLEVGLGDLFHLGLDLSVTDVSSKSGRWKNDDGSNTAFSNNYFTQNSPDLTYEKYYYKEANEKSVDADPTFLQRAGGFNADRYQLNQLSKFHTVNTGEFSSGGKATGTRNKREKRSQTISMLARQEMQDYGLTVDPQLSTNAQSYHIGEVTSVTPDGKRYVYGIAAYNNRQEETTFAVGTDEFGNNGYASSALDEYTGLIQYTPGVNNSKSNPHGVDNYYSNTIMPPYAHSYLLTAVLSSDYVDIDGVRGPSINDLGTYTKFNYTKLNSSYKWRTPFETNTASFNEGLKWTKQDDKANYVYGEKELWYLSSIETKNYMAIFSLDSRHDGFGVNDKNGGLSPASAMNKLNKISLYTLANYNAHLANTSVVLIPIKEVHFTYDYSLCPGVPNNDGIAETLNGQNINANEGKLTLKEISFSYQSSNKGRLSPYKFSYSSSNPKYNIKSYDRWGNYKAIDLAFSSTPLDKIEDPATPGNSNAEYPYVIQDTTIQNPNVRAWSLTQIGLPSGGTINVDYESDDYGYVQNKQAGQMFQIVGVAPDSINPILPPPFSSSSLPRNSDNYLIIKLQTAYNSTTSTHAQMRQQFFNQYLSGLEYVYFRFLYNMNGGTYEYVPGYIPMSSLSAFGVYPGGQYAYIKFNQLHTNDSGGDYVCPVTKAAIQYGRLNESKNMWAAPGSFSSNSTFGEQFLKDFVQSGFVKNIKDAVQDPNQALYDPNNHNCCQSFYLNKSWVRLNSPNMHKLGGGSRVKRISISDEWNGMTNTSMPTFSYGQEYCYTNDDGTSSGVASYEPMLGGDENPWHTPVFFDITHLLAPNDELYQEEPYGECFFPSPSVGYGQVTVQNIKYNGVTKHATGKLVHEFWTAKDFPTITSRTDLDAIREKTDPLSLSSFLHIDTRDYMTASQGFYIELNDMHGKPKGQKVFQEGISVPISSIEYDYQKSPYLNGSYSLTNTADVVDQAGGISNQNLGVFFDFVGDFREEQSSTVTGSLNANNDNMYIIIAVLDFPTIWPGFSSDKTQFRSSTVTKVVQRFGLLQKTIVKDLGSTVETDNVAYDAETGNVLLTKTTTDYNDAIYTLNYPAYWYYNGMGPAYENIDISMNNISFVHGLGNINNANTYFAPGDEIEINNPSGNLKAWVLSVSNNSITVEDKNGINPTMVNNTIKIIRSGRRNQQSVNMASITTLQNPLNGLNNNIYEQVIHASGTEYNEQWSVFCDCISAYAGPDPSLSYVTGAKGNWRPKRSFSYLTGRAQSNYDNNTNTRKDGVYTSYNPLYKKTGPDWQLDTTNWTFSSKVTTVNPHGEELENQDALGRYSAATYGYNQTFATAVSANARYREIGFDNVEDYNLGACADNHFKFNGPVIESTQAHTGHNSIRVSASNPLTMTKTLNAVDCPIPTPCEIDMTSNAPQKGGLGSGSAGTTYTFSGPGAQAPLTITWVVSNWILSNGAPTVTLVNGGIKVVGFGTITVTVTGASGCAQKFIIGGSRG